MAHPPSNGDGIVRSEPPTAAAETGVGGRSPALAAMFDRLAKMETTEGRRKGLSFRPRPGDVFIVTYPKSGTTWMQQIVHQLRSRGSMAFTEISAVVPYVEFAADCGQDLDSPDFDAWIPRAFKTHCWWRDVPKGPGVKYIIVVRDPADVLLSFFRFFEGWVFPPGAVSVDDFAAHFFLARGSPETPDSDASYWDHLLSWWPRRHDPAALFFFYEDLLAPAALAPAVARVAAFLGLESLPESESVARLATAVAHSGFGFMADHSAQFDEGLTRAMRNPAMGLPASAGAAGKVRSGVAGGGSALSVVTRAAVEARWAAVAAATGCATYGGLRARLREENAGMGVHT